MVSLPIPDEQFESGITVTRFAQATISGGIVTPGAETTFQITASVQPVKGDEIVNLPEGVRNREIIKFFTETEIREADEDAGTKSDVVDWNGKKFEVIRVKAWQMGALDHYHCYAAKTHNA